MPRRAVRTTECIAVACKGDIHDHRQDPRAALCALAGDYLRRERVLRSTGISAAEDAASSSRRRTCASSIRSGPRPTSPAITATWSTTRCSRSTRSSGRSRRWSTSGRVSDDKLTYTFTLRDGLKWHDGAAGAIAPTASPRSSAGPSATRSARSSPKPTDAWTAVDDKTFTIKLKKPFPLIARCARQALVATCRSSCRSASPRPTRSQQDHRGDRLRARSSSSRRSGCRATRWSSSRTPTTCRARSRRRWASGGKVVKVDRVEWLYIPDSATAAAALNAGEVDWWRAAAARPRARCSPRTRTSRSRTSTRWASMGMIRFNHLHPPFNNPKMRQALLYLVDQKDYVLGDRRRRQERQAVLRRSSRCGTPFESKAGAEVADRQARPRQGQAADQGGRLQGREDRGAVGHRPADRAQPGA